MTTIRTICDNMSDAIKAGTGAAVEVTCRDAEAVAWTVSGPDADVRAARSAMLAAGLTLTDSFFDPTPDADGEVDADRYDYWSR